MELKYNKWNICKTYRRIDNNIRNELIQSKEKQKIPASIRIRSQSHHKYKAGKRVVAYLKYHFWQYFKVADHDYLIEIVLLYHGIEMNNKINNFSDTYEHHEQSRLIDSNKNTNDTNDMVANRNSPYVNKNQTTLLVVGYLRLNQVSHDYQYTIKQLSQLIISFYCLNTIKIFNIDPYKKFAEIDLPQNSNISPVQLFHCNRSSYFVILNNNELYVRGDNCRGQLGLRTEKFKQETWMKHLFFNDQKSAKFISNGMISAHTFIKTTNNKLYTMGRNYYGSCCVEKEYKDIITPKLLFTHLNIIYICSGYMRSNFLTDSGLVYQCGVEEFGHRKPIEVFKSTQDYTMKQVLSLKNIKQIDCAYGTSYALDKNNILYSWGSNSEGMLGINDSNIIGVSKDNVQNVIQCHNDDDDIMSFCAGHSHCGYITVTGKLYMFGGNGSQECGIYDINKKELWRPELIESMGMHIIKDIQCGTFKTIVTTSENDYYQLHKARFNEVKKQPELMKFQDIEDKLDTDISTLWNMEIKLLDGGVFFVCYL